MARGKPGLTPGSRQGGGHSGPYRLPLPLWPAACTEHCGTRSPAHSVPLLPHYHMRAGRLKREAPPERRGAGLGPWHSACRHVAGQTRLSDARGLLRAEMSPVLQTPGTFTPGPPETHAASGPRAQGAPCATQTAVQQLLVGPAAAHAAAGCADRGATRSRPVWRQPLQHKSAAAAAADAAAALIAADAATVA